MNFKAAAGVTFQSLNETPNAQTYLTRGVGPAHAIGFTVSGSGAMPRDTPVDNQGGDNGAAAPDQGGSAAANDTRPGGGLGVPIDTPDPLNKYKWWILGGITLIFAAGAGFLMRNPAGAAAAAAPVPGGSPVANTPGSLLTALKDELFTLETDHLQGKLTDAEYEQQKQALELVLRRALGRKSA